jgi:hypothetical protein
MYNGTRLFAIHGLGDYLFSGVNTGVHAEKTLNAQSLQFLLQLANIPDSLVNAFEALEKNSGTILSSFKHYT